MSFEDVVRRRDFYDERLRAIDPIINRFCAKRGYVRDNNLGRYPGRSLRRLGEVECYIEVVLGFGPKGEQTWDLSDDAMFELQWAAHVLRGSILYIIHCGIPHLRVPLPTLAGMFDGWLASADATMSALDVETVMRTGKKIDRDAPFRLEDYIIDDRPPRNTNA